jgi:hypothetical protein
LRWFDQKHTEYNTLFLFKKKTGLSKVDHHIPHIAGIILNFFTKQITHPLFTSQEFKPQNS